MEKSKNQKNKVRFVVVREFSGEKSMREEMCIRDRSASVAIANGLMSL